MKRLVLCRHAKTEPIYHGISDDQRELLPRGLSDARLVAEDILKKGYQINLLVSSDAARAVQTANIIAGCAGYPLKSIRVEHFIYDGYTTADFLDFLGSINNDVNELWVVGHNPDIAMLAMRLTTGDFSHYPTSASAIISFDVQHWNEISVKSGLLEYFVFPKLLREAL